MRDSELSVGRHSTISYVQRGGMSSVIADDLWSDAESDVAEEEKSSRTEVQDGFGLGIKKP